MRKVTGLPERAKNLITLTLVHRLADRYGLLPAHLSLGVALVGSLVARIGFFAVRTYLEGVHHRRALLDGVVEGFVDAMEGQAVLLWPALVC